MAENNQKIQQYIQFLNNLTPGQTWVPADGYQALTKIDIEKKVFYPNNGIPVKVFINQTTGEMRMFPASIFES